MKNVPTIIIYWYGTGFTYLDIMTDSNDHVMIFNSKSEAHKYANLLYDKQSPNWRYQVVELKIKY